MVLQDQPVEVDTPTRTPSRKRRIYPWVVFALTFGLLLSDYMSRQVLSAVFPILKAEWDLSDSHLASLNSIVALMVGLLTLPLSILADRWGRVRSLVLMAVLWSVATLLCAIATSYEQMLGARFLVGVGEAAYGSVGIAVVLSVFAPRVHAALAGAFMAGGSFGSVIGVALGGFIAVQLGWRWSFAAMAIFGLILVALFRALVVRAQAGPVCRRRPADRDRRPRTTPDGFRAPISSLFTNPAVRVRLHRRRTADVHRRGPAGLDAELLQPVLRPGPDKAGRGRVGLRAAHRQRHGRVRHHHRPGQPRRPRPRSGPRRSSTASSRWCCLALGFRLGNGPVQLVLIGIGAFFSAGSSGPIAAMVANLTHSSVRASAMGTLTLANNLLGLALGPFVVGILADHLGLLDALGSRPWSTSPRPWHCCWDAPIPAGLRKLRRCAGPRLEHHQLTPEPQ